MVANLWNHKGSDELSFAYLEALKPPDETETYKPLSHHAFAFNTHNLGNDILGKEGFELAEEKYLLSPDRQRMFFMLSYNNGADGMQMVAAGRNSYDKSMRAGVAIGNAARVVICDNLVISGDVVVMQKHTKNLFQNLEKNLVFAFYAAANKWRDLVADVDRFKEVQMSEKDAHHFLVEAGRQKAISKSTFFGALEEYHDPTYEEFADTNLWSLYNHVTETLKKIPFAKTLETHRRFHDFARDFAGHKEVVADFTYNEPPVEEGVH